jgi:RNA-directed DNA polymerase
LDAPVEEPPATPGGGKRTTRPTSGTPQGGVISPLLANLYLHWFDKVFHAATGPAHWAQAKLVRYADDFVVLARYQSPALITFIETKLETWMGLEINREKTRVVPLRQNGASLDFLGFTFRYDRDRYRRGHTYLNVHPSKRAVARMRQTLRDHTTNTRCSTPIADLIAEINRQLTGWATYFRFGYPRVAFRQVNTYARQRLTQSVRRRSQRPLRPPEGVSYYEFLTRMGLVYL